MTSTILGGLPTDEPFRTRDANAAGVDAKQLAGLVTTGVLRNPVRGVYVSAALPDTTAVRVAALRLVIPPDAFATDCTAAWLHAGDQALPPNSDLQVPAPTFFRPSDVGRIRNDCCVSGERAVIDEDLTQVDGLLVTTPLRTAWDLGRLQSPDMAQWGLDLMMRVGGFSREQLLAGTGRFKGERGVVQLRHLCPWVDPGSESFGESALRNRWRGGGLPRPETQIIVYLEGGVVVRIDMGLPEVLLGAEFFGQQWHDQEAAEHDAARLACLRDQRGYLMEAFRGKDVFGPGQDAETRLALAYAQARAALPQKRHFLLM